MLMLHEMLVRKACSLQFVRNEGQPVLVSGGCERLPGRTLEVASELVRLSAGLACIFLNAAIPNLEPYVALWKRITSQSKPLESETGWTICQSAFQAISAALFCAC